MIDPDDLLDSFGGSLLNDLLSELNASVLVGDDNDNDRRRASSSRINNNDDNDDDDDVFAILERELTSTYYAPPPPPSSSSSGGGPPGMMMRGGRNDDGPTAAAFVLGNQRPDFFLPPPPPPPPGIVSPPPPPPPPPPGGVGVGVDDAWSDSLSRFGGMSLVSDFLAADVATKRMGGEGGGGGNGGGRRTVVVPPFEETFDFDGEVVEEEYALEEEEEEDGDGGNKAKNNASSSSSSSGGGGLASLLGASRASGGSTIPIVVASSIGTEGTTTARGAPPPPPRPDRRPVDDVVVSVPTAPVVVPPFPPPASASFIVAPPPRMSYPQIPPPPPPHHPHMPPSAVRGGGGGGGGATMMMMTFPHHHPSATTTTTNRASILPPMTASAGILPAPYDDEDFPALSSTKVARAAVDVVTKPESHAGGGMEMGSTAAVVVVPSAAQCIFNNANPFAPPVDARLVSTMHMPSRDVCYVVHLMLRSLKSTDAYNDDYYHWSVATNGIGSGGIVNGGGGGGGASAPPNPVWKEIKVIAKAREEKYHTSVRARARTFADKNKSLGQLDKTNVKRPRALLDTPVMRMDDDDGNDDDVVDSGVAATAADSKYELERQSGRIRLWKARVTIDKGHTALLSLIELRRLIQANVGAPGLIGELMVDVKANVDLLHSSLGVIVKIDSREGKTIEIDDGRLAGTLSMPKGRVLCARAIEEGILPHSSACALLPMALSCILSSQSSADGEDRLIRALTGLILLTNPGVDPSIFCRCLDVPISLSRDGKKDVSAIAGSIMRMNLLHAILSMGKDVCAGSRASEEWFRREEIFRGILEESQK